MAQIKKFSGYPPTNGLSYKRFMKDSNKLKITHDKDDQRFYADIEGEEAELTYTFPEDNTMDFDHTFVPQKARGKGIADHLVKTGLDYAKSNSYKAIASCPVVDAYVKRHPEYKSILKEI